MGNHRTRYTADQQRVARLAITRIGQRRRDAGQPPGGAVTAVELVAELIALGFVIAPKDDPGNVQLLRLRSLTGALVQALPPDRAIYRDSHVDHLLEAFRGAMVEDAFTAGHGYLSTACLHALIDGKARHADCRVVCKYGGEVCACPVCDHEPPDPAAPPAGRKRWTYDVNFEGGPQRTDYGTGEEWDGSYFWVIYDGPHEIDDVVLTGQADEDPTELVAAVVAEHNAGLPDAAP